MSYGIQIVLDNGKTINTNSFSCNTYDLITYTTGTGTYSRSYPELVGFNVYAMVQKISNNSRDACGYASVSYPLGVPTVAYGTLIAAFSGGGNTSTYIYVVVS